MITLESIDLVPVIELDPFLFSTRDRSPPSGAGTPEEWNRYWLESLADSGVVGLTPLRVPSWLVPAEQLVDFDVRYRILAAIVRDWGGPEVFSEPNHSLVLSGGLALCSGRTGLVGPTCCSDLGNLSDWKDAVGYRQAEWAMLWIGHPWLSVRFDSGLLVLSEPHESDSPTPRWGVTPHQLGKAVLLAESRLETLAQRLKPILEAMKAHDPMRSSRTLAGLKVRE